MFLSSCSPNSKFQSLSSRAKSLSPISSNNWLNQEVESFKLHSEKASIDFLVLTDSSQSMFHRLSHLGHSLSDLLYVISDYDWQIAFSSVDHGDYKPQSRHQSDWRAHIAKGRGQFGSLMNLDNGSYILSKNILNPQSPDYEKLFLHTLSHVSKIDCNRPPFCSNPMEQALRSLKSAIERASFDNRDLFRDSSEYFISILVSNEDERKEDSQRATTAQEVISAFDKQFQDKKFLHYSIVISDPNCLKEEKQKNSSTSISYASIKLSQQTGGAVMSLCSQNYGAGLRQISQHIKNKLKNSFFLKEKPVPGSVEIHFSKNKSFSWTLRDREILFDNKNFENIEGTVSYQALK